MPSPTQAQTDAANVFEQRIEQAFDDTTALGAIRAELVSADVTDFDRDYLLGRIEQYKADRQHVADAAAITQGGTDGRAG